MALTTPGTIGKMVRQGNRPRGLHAAKESATVLEAAQSWLVMTASVMPGAPVQARDSPMAWRGRVLSPLNDCLQESAFDNGSEAAVEG